MIEMEDIDDAPAPLRAIDPRSVPVRISKLKKLGQSPAHYYEAIQHADGAGATQSLRTGTAADAAALDKPRVIWDRKTKTGRTAPRSGADWEAFRAEHADKLVLTPAEARKADDIADAIRRHPIANELMYSPTVAHDVGIQWSIMGRACSSHLDALSPTAVIDLKTAASANPERFTRSALFYAYHAQLAFYVDACKATGRGDLTAYIVVVESSPPYPVTVLHLDDDAIEAGRRLYRGWFERLLVCEAENYWPGYCESVVAFSVPDMESEALIIGGEEIEL